MAPTAYFSATYQDAREKFLTACADRPLDVDSRLNPNAKGAQGEDLFTDIALIGSANASKVLILTSATHGVEGYCGSGAQVGLLREGYFSDLPSDVAILMIHAVNPYGFSHNRRVNEDNVDLNRNFIDFTVPGAAESPYSEIHPMILPEVWEGPEKEAADQGLMDFMATKGMKQFQAAVSEGQYLHKDGIFYGGQKPTWSNQMIRSVLPQYASKAAHVGVIDFHTGLGPYGYGELISDGSPQQKALAKAWYGEETTDPEAGTSTSAPLTGTLVFGVAESLPEAQMAFIALEYGTFDVQRVLQAVRGDNWLYHKGELNSPLGAAIKEDIREAFYPDKDDWKEAVWTRATEVVGMALKGLNAAT